MSATEWTIESDGSTNSTSRFAEAIRTYADAPAPKRFLRNGRPLRMTDDDPTLFEETTCS